MDLRVTPQVMIDQAIANAQRQTDQLAQLQAQASSGNRILSPSDDPTAEVQVMAGNAQNLRLDSYLSNITTATSSLNGSVSALQEANSILSQARDVAVQGSNSTNDATSFEALAQQVDAFLNRLVNVANTQDNGHYLFSGTATTTAPFKVAAADGQGRPQSVVYQGSQDTGTVTVNQQQSVATRYPGSQIFQTSAGGAGDAFAVLMQLRDDLRNTKGMGSAQQLQALSQDVGAIDQVNSQVLQTTGEQSASLQSLDALQSRLKEVQLNTQEFVSNTGGADLSKVVIGMTEQQNLLRLTLASAAQVFNQSLLDFIK
jgi:flagellar hook-associated protein 3 FlgL